MDIPWFSRLHWLYNSTIIIRHTHTAHAYVHNTVQLATIILSKWEDFISNAGIALVEHNSPMPKTEQNAPPIVLLSTCFVGSKETLPSTPTTAREELPIVPSYLQHPPFPFYEINIEEALSVPNTSSQCGTGHSQLAAQNDQDLVLARKMEKLKILGSSEQRSDADVCGTVNNASLCGMEEKHNHRDMQSSSHDNKLPNKEIEGLNDQGGLASLSTNPLLVKVRVVGSGESDFVEVEVPSPTYPALLKACCEELEVQTSDVVKIRKLPNVWVRKDRDVQRMKEGQELEVVLDMERSKE